MARKYYAKLFREYCIADLSRYKVMLIGMQATSTLQEPRPGAVAFSMPRLIVLQILKPKRRMEKSGCGGARRRRWLRARGSSCVARAAAMCDKALHPSRCAKLSQLMPFVCTRCIMQTHDQKAPPAESLLIQLLAGAVCILGGRRAEGSTGEAAAVPQACAAAQPSEKSGGPQGTLLLCRPHTWYVWHSD